MQAIGATATTESTPTWCRRFSRWLILILILPATLPLTLVNVPSAFANTPSTWSHTVAGTSIEYGWTTDHAWVIVDYADAIKYGAGFVAGQVCAVVIGEEGPFMGSPCSRAVTQIVGSLVQGHPRLSNHGLWVAVYLWPYHTTMGTW